MLVAPYMGAWIEIRCRMSTNPGRSGVAPYMGAWIEILLHQRQMS